MASQFITWNAKIHSYEDLSLSIIKLMYLSPSPPRDLNSRVHIFCSLYQAHSESQHGLLSLQDSPLHEPLFPRSGVLGPDEQEADFESLSCE